MARRSFCRHLGVLLWKNWLLKRRTWLTTFLEIALPVFIMAIIVAIRGAISSTDYAVDLHVEDSQPFNADVAHSVANYLAAWPKGKNSAALNSQKIVFAAVDQSSLAPIIGNFTAQYPVLAASIQYYTPDAIQDYMKGSDYGVDGHPYVAAVLQVDQVGSAANGWQWAYTIRLNSSQTVGDGDIAGLPDMTQSAYNSLHWTYQSDWTQLVQNGEVFFQSFFESYALMTAMGSSSMPSRNLSFTPMPVPPYIQDDFADTVGTFLGLLFTVVFLWPVTRIIKLVVEEKETRIKEGMKMMGLYDSTLWLSWLITYTLIFIVTSILITVITANNVFQYSNKGYIFFFFLLAQLSFFSFCLLVSSVFSQSRVGSTFGALVFLAIFFPYYAVYQDSVSTAQKTLACLSPPLCMGLGVTNIIQFEGAQTGVTKDNVSTKLNNFDYSTTMGMLLLDFVGLILLALYMEKVFHQQYGLALPWYFPLQPSYWFPSLKRPPALSGQMAVSPTATGRMEPVVFSEEEAARHELGVSIKSLRKEFVIERGQAPHVAVAGLSLDLYTGQLFCLLGHNGAGKSTTLSMLSGMLPPTSGDALVFGQSILNAMPSIRSTLGVCPQHNILFSLLTVKEHLQLYAVIKGVEKAKVEEAVLDMIKQVGLEEKVHVRSHALSGGMQRKLSVAIALIGDSRIVFLDEPTSGMDPYSRRATWDMLKKKKEGRVIILTTHFMDEADQLGDRIAIMAHGAVQCVGSPLYLKSAFGIGYSLTVVKDPQCDEDAVQASIRQHVPQAELVNNIAGEMAYKLPTSSSPAFADLFDTFDDHLQPWAIQSYHIGVTTLEHVFLRVGKDADAAAKIHGKSREDIHALAAATEAASREVNRAAEPGSPRRVDVAEKKGWVVEMTSPSAAGQGQGRSEAEEKTSITGVNPLAQMSSASQLYDRNFVALSSPVPQAAPSSPGPPEAFDAFGVIEYDHSHKTLRHVRALFIKRLQNARRNKKNWCWTVIIPFLVMIIFLATTKALNDIHVPDDTVDLTQYNLPNVVDFASATPAILSPISGGAAQVVLTDESSVTLSNSTQFAEYLYASSSSMQLSRFGAFLYTASVSSGAGLTEQTEIFFNTTAPYSLPAFLNVYNTALLRSITGSPNANIQLHFWGFPEVRHTRHRTDPIGLPAWMLS